MAEITQADRDAAAKLFYSLNVDDLSPIKSGKFDHHSWVKSFAHHRAEAEHKIVEWLRESPHFVNGHGIADAIEAGRHLK